MANLEVITAGLNPPRAFGSSVWQLADGNRMKSRVFEHVRTRAGLELQFGDQSSKNS